MASLLCAPPSNVESLPYARRRRRLVGFGRSLLAGRGSKCVFAIGNKIVFPAIRMEAEADIPTDIRDDFNEALRSLNGNNAKAAVIMTRSALQGAARQQGAEGKTLKDEIDDLAAKHVIPPALQDWAHELAALVQPEPPAVDAARL